MDLAHRGTRIWKKLWFSEKLEPYRSIWGQWICNFTAMIHRYYSYDFQNLSNNTLKSEGWAWYLHKIYIKNINRIFQSSIATNHEKHAPWKYSQNGNQNRILAVFYVHLILYMYHVSDKCCKSFVSWFVLVHYMKHLIQKRRAQVKLQSQ